MSALELKPTCPKCKKGGLIIYNFSDDNSYGVYCSRMGCCYKIELTMLKFADSSVMDNSIIVKEDDLSLPKKTKHTLKK